MVNAPETGRFAQARHLGNAVAVPATAETPARIAVQDGKFTNPKESEITDGKQ